MFNTILIIVSVLLTISILLQQKGAGASGGIFGGGGGGGFDNSFQAKRGFDKVLFYSTIVLAILFIGIAFLRLVIF